MIWVNGLWVVKIKVVSHFAIIQFEILKHNWNILFKVGGENWKVETFWAFHSPHIVGTNKEEIIILFM
jgi:hypothetical protein